MNKGEARAFVAKLREVEKVRHKACPFNVIYRSLFDIS